jgi:CRISPR type III-A-associated RAMP protein Csm4
VRQKVTLRAEPWDYLGQASVEQSLPYFVEEVHFPQGQGVYFRVAFLPKADAETRNLFQAALRLLSEEGIGSARTRGLGHFTFALDDAARWQDLDALPAGDQHLLMGRMIPSAHDHAALQWERSTWHLQKVAGYMAAAPREADRLRRKMGQYLLGPGSLLVMPHAPQGRCVNLAPEGYGLPALREGRPFFLSFQPPTA